MDSSPRTLSLCAGIGGLDLGIQLALPGSRTVCFVERDAFACEVLAHQMEEGGLDQAPVWTDLRTFDGTAWRGCVDLIAAGYPCQPFSVAGQRQGEDDERHLWPEVHRIIGEVRPNLVILENVPGHIRLGFERVLADLAGLGFDAEWATVRASDVGSCHRRERLFVVGYSNRTGLQGWHGPQRQGAHELPSWPPGPTGDWSSIPRGLWPATPQPKLRGVDDAGQSPDRMDPHRDRIDRLRCLGNAVVPQQAALAIRHLLARIGHDD